MASLQFDNLNRVMASLLAQRTRYGKSGSVQAGYSAPYAAIVHEDLSMPHPNGGQAKYLEQPAREGVELINFAIQQKIKQKKSLRLALRAGAETLLALSYPLVPVDTNYLRSSSYIAEEGSDQEPYRADDGIGEIRERSRYR